MITSMLWASVITPTEEIKWSCIRRHRNNLLSASDWTMVGDSPLSDEKQVIWMEYRSALRDITATFSNPDDVIFPAEPEQE